MKPETMSSSIALKHNKIALSLFLLIITFICALYFVHNKRIQDTQLHSTAENISENVLIAHHSNLNLAELDKITNSQKSLHYRYRVFLIQEGTILDSVTAENRALSELESLIFNRLNTQPGPEVFEQTRAGFFYIKKSGALSVFVHLNKSALSVPASNMPQASTGLFFILSLGILAIFGTLAYLQKHILLTPLNKLTKHLSKQAEGSFASQAPLKIEVEFEALLSEFNSQIKQHKEKNKVLSKTYQEIYGIANNAPVLLSYIGSDLNFKFVNQAHEDWFGMPIEVFVDNSLEDIFGSHSLDLIKPEIEKVLSGERTDFETTIPYQYLEDKIVHMSLAPNQSGKEAVDGFFICIEDISEARRNETKLADYAQRIECREFALEEEKVIAEQALKVKSEFLASMSHEIRTPMNGVLGMLHLLMETNLNNDQQTKAKLAKNSAESLLNLINDILDFSKVESGKLEIEQIDFNLIELLENTTEGLSKLAEDKALPLILDTASINEVMFKGDPNRIRQVLNNLLSNAIKFTNQGDITVSASLYEEMPGQYNLICEVSDTGIGIEQSQLDTIFDSFSQVDASTTRKYGGTGLGLAIAKKLCQLMGGDIVAKSIPNQGSKFTFTVSLAESDKPSNIAYSLELTDTPCIIIDSNQANTKNISKQLEAWGAPTRVISSAHDAIQRLRTLQEIYKQANSIIVLINLEQAGQLGLELIKQARDSHIFENLKFVLMSPLSFNQETNQLNDLDISSFFYRPVTKIKLFNAISSSKGPGTHTLEERYEIITEEDFPSNKRILLVEDTPINQLVVKGILSTFKVECDVANNGVDALDKLQNSSHYDVIFMDCQMPEMDGYEATKAIRDGAAGEHYKAIPIIAMTANAMKGDEEVCLNAGMNDYMSKPISAHIIKEKLIHWLANTENKR